MGRLDNKVIVVTGGAQGIGLATVQEFLRQGATVVAGDIRAPGIEFGPSDRVSYDRVDVSDPAQVQALVSRAVTDHGQLDVLFNNAGRHLPKSVIDAEVEDFDAVFDVNVKSVFLGMKFAIPHMLERGRGTVISTTSNGGVMGRPGDPIYNASKHAIVGLTRSAALAYAAQGIRVNAVAPGAIDTAMLRGSIPEGKDLEQALPLLVASTPAARVGTADEVAQTVVFLASDESRFINGVIIPIDGAKSAGAMTADRYRTDIEVSRLD